MFCTYLTIYFGDKMPPFYVGSSNVARVLNGYHGTVLSKRYKSIWKSEIRHHPELFCTLIISEHPSREEALQEERQIQEQYNVVAGDEFINQALATVNGFFGRDVSGQNNPMYGRGHLLKGSRNGMYGVHRTGDKSLGRRGPDHWCYGKRVGPAHPMFGLHGDKNPNTGKIWINNGKIRRFVKPDVADEMTKHGFVRGYLKG